MVPKHHLERGESKPSFRVRLGDLLLAGDLWFDSGVRLFHVLEDVGFDWDLSVLYWIDHEFVLET